MHPHSASRSLSSIAALTLSLCACAARMPVHLPVQIIEGFTDAGSVLAFADRGELLARGGRAGRVALWRVPGFERAGGWQAHTGAITGLVFLGTALVTSGGDGDLVRWRRDGAVLQRRATSAPITALLALPDGTLVTGHQDGTVRFWSGADLMPLQTHRLHRAPVTALAWSQQLHLLASSAGDRTVLLSASGSEPRALAVPPAATHTLAFGKGGGQLVGAGWMQLFVWEVADGRLATLSTPHHGLITRLDPAPDESYLASVSRITDSSVYLLDPRSGEAVEYFGRHPLCGTEVRFSPDGRWLASTSDEGGVRIWRLH